MKYAEIAVNSPIARGGSYCYSIPSNLNIETGQAVWVPFGPRTLQGIVVKQTDIPSFDEVKDIEGIIFSRPLISSSHAELAQWMSSYYLSPIFDCVSLMLPPGFERNIKTWYRIIELQSGVSLSDEQKQVIDLFGSKKRLNLKEIEKKLGVRKSRKQLADLVSQGVLEKFEELTESHVKPKIVRYLKLNVATDHVAVAVEALKGSKAAKQSSAVEFLAGYPEGIAAADFRRQFKNSAATLKALVKKGTVSLFEKEVRREPLSRYHIVPAAPPELTESQGDAWKTIESGLSADKPEVFLLQGVTGSGKTEIYLRSLAKVVAGGKKGICLVPEISLTPQTIERFASRFPGRIAVFHSGLTPGEQFDEWRRIADGCCDVVIGPRSALFTPQPNLGLIIIDEEHEWTYKQTDKTPRYHARTAAIKLAQLCGAQVVLGSATPDVESYYRATRGIYKLVELPERITVRGITPLPEVEIIDMRQELKAGNSSIFSRSLLQSLRETLEKHEQSILFINRRGAANFARCLSCGFTLRCPRCLVALTYHAVKKKLVCHHCNYRAVFTGKCPECAKPRVKLFGTGTEKVEEEMAGLFPSARLIRWDSDVTGAKGSHEEILKKLVNHQADILIGTQMIAKGLDLPQVTLAGVINADTGLNYPDFRSGERTFQLTCQIAGRAGRGMGAGKVIIQTYSPGYYAIQSAAKHDYRGFYQKEMEYRTQLGYPPLNQLANLLFSHTSPSTCREESQKMLKLLVAEKEKKGWQGLRFMGPVPASVPRVRGKYRWQILLCGKDLPEFLKDIELPRGWSIDIDPMGVF